MDAPTFFVPNVPDNEAEEELARLTAWVSPFPRRDADGGSRSAGRCAS